jgi:hypothetical protein
VNRHLILRRLAPLALLAITAVSCGKSPTRPNSEFELEIIWLGTQPNGPTTASFDAAANTIRSTILGALSTVAVPESFTNLSQCGLSGHPDVSRENIDGLRIYLVVEAIDGPSGTLGSAGPCLIRNNNIPALGVMRFDEADVANLQADGRLRSVALHEMLHVLGIGTVWYGEDGLVDTTDTPSDVRYTGPLARSACASLSGGATVCAATVPVHSLDGAGSRFSHWRETVFQSELMTPFLGAGGTPFSVITIQALADLGYEVGTSQADAYSVPGGSSVMADGMALREHSVRLGEPMQPRWKLDGAGRLTPYRPRR